jgi:hypothetical protein
MTPTRPAIASFSLIAFFVLVACSAAAPTGTPAAGTPTGGQPTSQPTTTAGATDEGEPTPGTALSSCELVTPADIEAAVELDAGTVQPGLHKDTPTPLDPADNECRYEGDWGGLVVMVTPTNGKNTFDAVKKSFGEDAEEIAGVGDGALWFADNDRGYFVKGSVLVLLQFTHLVDTELTSFRDPTIAIGTAAVGKI